MAEYAAREQACGNTIAGQLKAFLGEITDKEGRYLWDHLGNALCDVKGSVEITAPEKEVNSDVRGL